MATPARRYTADDCYRLQRVDIGYELVDGELVEVMPVNLPHGRIAGRLARYLDQFVEEHGGGRVYVEAGFVLNVPGDPERVRGPDVAFVSDETLAAAGGEPRKSFARLAPDLAIEVHSPENARDARGFHQKIRDYLDAGVRLIWAIYPDGRYATALHLDGSARLLRESEALDGEHVLPGFRLPLAKLFD